MNQNKGNRKLELFTAIQEAVNADHAAEAIASSPANPALDFPGQLMHTEQVHHKPVLHYINNTVPAAVELEYRVFVSPCMTDPYDHVGISAENVEIINQRIACGDVWAWCDVTVQVRTTNHGFDNVIGSTEHGSGTFYGVHDFLSSAGAYTLMKVMALRDLSKRIEVINQETEMQVMMHLAGAVVAGDPGMVN